MKLGNYKGLHVRQASLDVRESEIDNVFARVQRMNAVIVHVDDGDNIRKILESQPIDDDFALDFSEYDTIGEWREAVRAELEQQRSISAEEKMQRELLSMIIADSDIPVESDLAEEIRQILYDELLMDLEENGISLEMYLNRTGTTEDQVWESKMDEALFAIRSESVLRAIAEREGLTVLPNEVADEIVAMAAEEDEDPAELADELDDEDLDAVWDELLMGKAMGFVMDHAVIEN